MRFNGAAMAAGGVAVALGKLPRTASAGLILSLVPTTYAGHQFWTVEDPAVRKAHQTTSSRTSRSPVRSR